MGYGCREMFLFSASDPNMYTYHNNVAPSGNPPEVPTDLSGIFLKQGNDLSGIITVGGEHLAATEMGSHHCALNDPLRLRDGRGVSHRRDFFEG
jgi:hypothetical protein